MGSRTRWEVRYQRTAADPLRLPSLFLRKHLDALPRGRALDIACGDGRHAVFLARHGFQVEAIDIALAGLRKAQALARRDRLPVHLVAADLETFPLPRDRYATVVNIRYLQRELWPALKAALQEGGMLVFETFLSEQRNRFGHPANPAFLLERGELRPAFRDFEVLDYEEGLVESETGPAFLARMLARRPRREKAD